MNHFILTSLLLITLAGPSIEISPQPNDAKQDTLAYNQTFEGHPQHHDSLLTPRFYVERFNLGPIRHCIAKAVASRKLRKAAERQLQLLAGKVMASAYEYELGGNLEILLEEDLLVRKGGGTVMIRFEFIPVGQDVYEEERMNADTGELEYLSMRMGNLVADVIIWEEGKEERTCKSLELGAAREYFW
ncbi:MAG: hypothetical protein AAFP83_01585 [Bacteroidota bacterium]